MPRFFRVCDIGIKVFPIDIFVNVRRLLSYLFINVKVDCLYPLVGFGNIFPVFKYLLFPSRDLMKVMVMLLCIQQLDIWELLSY